MKKYLVLALIFKSATVLTAQSSLTEGFEKLTIDSGQVINGKNGESKFNIELPGSPFKLKMPILYDTSFGGYWAGGWAISKKIDGALGASDFSKHLYCAKPGRGSEKNSSGAYVGNGFAVGMNGTHISSNAQSNQAIRGFKVANSTYAYNSMKNGDGFAKKFGGASGNDPDSFVLSVRFFVDTILVGSKRIVLADYRFADNAKDYVLDSWQYVALPTYFSQGPCDSIVFELQSSDNGQFGMNTPGFFCIDELSIAGWLATKSIEKIPAKAYPNPARDFVEIQTQNIAIDVQVLDALGRVVCTQPCDSRKVQLDVANWSVGSYQVIVTTAAGQESTTFVKQ